MLLPTKFWKIIALISVGFVSLTACNDDNNNTVAPPAPNLVLAPKSVKTLAFNWADVRGETEYRLLENADGASGYVEIASLAANTTSFDHVVFLPSRVNASYILQACNSHGCTDSATVFVTGNLASAIGYVKASNTGVGDYFGVSVALSGDGNTLAVGAPGEASNATGVGGDQTNNGANDSGAVYVFIRSGTTWLQQAYLKASNTESMSEFGFSIALNSDGNTLAVGAPREKLSGAVYIFSRSDTNWSQQAYLKANITSLGDRFGNSVALASDGNTLAVGAKSENSGTTGVDGDQINEDANDSGAVYIFSRNDAEWSQQTYLKASNTGINDWFGHRVALSGDGSTLAVGASYEDNNATGVNGDQDNDEAENSGAVYIFSRSGNSWSQQAYIKASAAGFYNLFGSSLALSGDGNTLAVGAEGSSDGDQDNMGEFFIGAAYVFSRSNDIWSQQARLEGSSVKDDKAFGASVSLSDDGNTLAVGEPGESGSGGGVGGGEVVLTVQIRDSGAVYLFSRENTVWSQKTYIKAPSSKEDEQFGVRVALSGDGKTLAVGAPSEGSSATGVGGDRTDNGAEQSGAVYLY